ncbi:MAG: citrate (Si)-synthase [Parachlamydiaceae bacterium]
MTDDQSEVLFEIKKEHLETGLRGFPIGYCTTSVVHPTKGLIYVDKSIQEIASWTPERVIYLLYHGQEGTKAEEEIFAKDLSSRAKCSKELIASIQKLPRLGHPMKLFCAALLMAQVFEGKDNYREDCLNLIAKIPEITAAVINHHAGWGETPPGHPELGYMENFSHMLNVPNGDKKRLAKTFGLFNVLHFDHGGGNLSTFVGKAVASSLEDIYGSICAAMCALDGPKHGRANQDSLEFVESLINELGPNATAEKVEASLRKRLAENQLVFGYGHAVLRVEDPRAIVLYDKAKRQYADHPLVKMALLLREVAPKILAENPKISDPYANVDAISGVLLTAAGFPYREYFTVLFGLARVVGIAIQIVYERCEARGGKGTPIVRPKYLFKAKESETK